MKTKFGASKFFLTGLLLCAQSFLISCSADELANAAAQRVGTTSSAGGAMNPNIVGQLWAKYIRMGTSAFKKNDYSLALQFFEESKQEAELLSDKAKVAQSLDCLALVYQSLGKADESMAAAEKALTLRLDSANSVEQKIDALIDVANMYLDQNKFDKAKIYFDKAESLLSSAKGDSTRDRQLEINDGLLNINMSRGDFAAAKNLLSSLISADKKRPADEAYAKHLEQNARVLFNEGKIAEAKLNLEDAAKVRNVCQSPDAPEIVSLNRNLLRIEIMSGNLADADNSIGKLLNFDRAKLAPNSVDYLYDYLTLGELKYRHGELPAAKQIAVEVSNSLKGSQSEKSPEMADAYSLLGQVAASEQKWSDAKLFAEQAQGLREAMSLPAALSVNDVETNAKSLAAEGKIAESAAVFQKAISIRQVSFPDDQQALAQCQQEMQALSAKIAKVDTSKTETRLSEDTTARPQ